MKLIFNFFLVSFFFSSFQLAEARIRNRKVKEAPKSCKLMSEDSLLSRKEKKVLGTLRHSLLIEEDVKSITLVKDKGEKICQWSFNQWSGIQSDNNLPDVSSFKFHIDEYKNVIYPYVEKADKSYFVMSIPIETCDLSNQITKTELAIPRCEKPKTAKRKFAKNKARKFASKR